MWQKLKAWFAGPSRAKDAEAIILKSKLHNRVDDLKDKAAKGDSDATLKLGSLKQGLTEQSLRMPSKSGGKPILLCVAVLALVVGGGCNVPGEYVEADRLTYEAVAPRYIRYVEADPELAKPEKKDEKDRILRTVQTWKLRIDKNK